MRLYSTNNPKKFVSLKEAVFKGLPEDNGLYMPKEIPKLPEHFIRNLSHYSFQDIGFEICRHLFDGAIADKDLRAIIEAALTFPAPVVQLDENIFILELFHGPTLAFKDFGARFMAQLMAYFNRQDDKERVILVATSGDTGGAVASGFHQTPGIRVVILYPAGKVSELQEKQLTTLGANITAIEVEGTFDDCQVMVKQAFLDKDLISSINLSSANSINIARLIPQSFYYFEAYKQLDIQDAPLVFSVPSGNFGNLTAGIMAKKMGLPVHQFIAATNVNDVVPSYLANGIFQPRTSIPTISNAMDVGNPSNFTRMLKLYGSTWNNLKDEIKGYAFDDESTKSAVKEVFDQFNYTIDPHGAVGFLALKQYRKENVQAKGIILETAHPSKFLPTMERILKLKIPIPDRLASLQNKTKEVVSLVPEYGKFKQWLLGEFKN